jgi:hypothetical protein
MTNRSKVSHGSHGGALKIIRMGLIANGYLRNRMELRPPSGWALAMNCVRDRGHLPCCTRRITRILSGSFECQRPSGIAEVIWPERGFLDLGDLGIDFLAP